jgi:alpha-galactosidase
VKELEDGSRAVGFCNFGQDIVNLSYKDFKKLGITGKQRVRDLWRQKNITDIQSDSKTLSLTVPVHGVVLYKFTSVK